MTATTTPFVTDIQTRLPDGEQLLLLGVTGSTAYGLNHADSDIDRLGLYRVDIGKVLGFGFNFNDASREWTEPDDVQLHEIAKFLHLVMNGNPTVTELLFLDDYEYLDPALESLIENRTKLLSGHKVRNAYVGYAVAQAKRLQNRELKAERGSTRTYNIGQRSMDAIASV